MDARTRRAMHQMVSQVTEWVKTLAEGPQAARSAHQLDKLERRVRVEGLNMLGTVFEMLPQSTPPASPGTRVTGGR